MERDVFFFTHFIRCPIHLIIFYPSNSTQSVNNTLKVNTNSERFSFSVFHANVCTIPCKKKKSIQIHGKHFCNNNNKIPRREIEENKTDKN